MCFPIECDFLFQVAKVHPKDSRYLLRDDFYKCVQKDWPGYGDGERQLISRMLARWVGGSGGLAGPPPLMSLWV